MPSRASAAVRDRIRGARRKKDSKAIWWAYTHSEFLPRYKGFEPDIVFPRDSATEFYHRTKRDEFWDDAYDALRTECMKVDASRGAAETEKCSCEDDSRNIPCDGLTHERTFGPVSPSWQLPFQMRGTGATRTLDEYIEQLNRLGRESKTPDDDDVRAYIHHFGPMNARQFRGRDKKTGKRKSSVGHVPSKRELNKRRWAYRDSMDVGSRGVRKTSGSELTRAEKDGTEKSLLRRFITEDASGLRTAITNWVSSLTCNLGVACRDAYPHVMGQSKQNGGSGAPTAYADKAGKDNWYVAGTAKIPAAGGEGAFPVACVRARFLCHPFFPVLIPENLPEDPETAERIRRAEATDETSDEQKPDDEARPPERDR